MAVKQINMALGTLTYSAATSSSIVLKKGQRMTVQDADPDSAQHLREYEGDGTSTIAQLVSAARYRPAKKEVDAALTALNTIPGGGDTVTVSGAGQALANGTYVRNDGAPTGSLTPMVGAPIYQLGDVVLARAAGASNYWFIYNADYDEGYYSSADEPTDPWDVATWNSLNPAYDPPPFSVTTGSTTIAAAIASKASVSYVDVSIANAKVGLWNDRGNYDASGNVFPSTGGSGTAGAILKGDVWTVSVVGTLGGAAVDVGDTVRAVVDSPGNVAGDWAIAETNVEQATEVERGTLKVAPSVAMENPANTDDTSAVTPKKWYEGFAAALGTTGFRNAVRGVLLDGLSVASSAAVTAADSILVAIGKLQAQLTGLLTVTINAQSGTTYTLALTDAGPNKYLRQSNAGAITTTFPDNATVAFPVGSQVSGIQAGDGQVTLTPAAGVTFTGLDGAYKTLGKGAPWTAIKTGTDTWDIMGSLTT